MTETPDRTAAHDRDVNEYRHDYPEFDYEERIAAFAAALEDGGVDAAVLPNAIDCTYFTGSGQPMLLYVPAGRPEAAHVFVRRARGFAKQEVGLPDSRFSAGGLSALEEYAESPGTVGVPREVIPATLDERLAETLDCETVNVSETILELRARKDDDEVDLIRTAAGLYEQVDDAIERRAAPGVTEKELAGAVSDSLISAGMDDRIFFRGWNWRLPAAGLIVSGDALPLISGHAMTVTGVGTARSMPWGPSNRELEQGDFIVADMAMNYAGYHGDVARTYTLGEPTADQREWFDLTLDIHAAAREALEPGVSAETPYIAARDRAQEHGVADWLCGYGEMQAPYIGHSIGLEADEEPTLMRGNQTPLEEGMVLTIEPKLMHPERGAVMVEDDYLVTSDGIERLSTAPQELRIIPVDD
ncbi:MAG: M24 family metallopeptidase [Haloglomus sp.]